jgi:uncharacterized membrane protein YbhN (UPF0104 family)
MDETNIEKIKSLSGQAVFRDFAFALLFLLFGSGIPCFALFGTFFHAANISGWGWVAIAVISLCAMNIALLMWAVYCFTRKGI